MLRLTPFASNFPDPTFIFAVFCALSGLPLTPFFNSTIPITMFKQAEFQPFFTSSSFRYFPPIHFFWLPFLVPRAEAFL